MMLIPKGPTSWPHAQRRNSEELVRSVQKCNSYFFLYETFIEDMVVKKMHEIMRCKFSRARPKSNKSTVEVA